jgi:vancomycin resistance protein YoaR
VTKQWKNTIFCIVLCGSFLPYFVYAQDADTTVLALTVDGVIKDRLSLSDITQFTDIRSTLLHDPTHTSEIEKLLRCVDAQYEPCLLTANTRDQYTTKNYTKTYFDDVAIKAFVDDIARKVNTDPVNAKLRFNEETGTLEEIAPHVHGVTVDVEKSITNIIAALEKNNNHTFHTLELPHEIDPARVTSDNAQDLGIKELIGEGRSNFTGSTKSRIHNIETAAQRFDGLVIAPDEEFSFVKILGPVDGEHGYKEELVIRDNETKPEFGGGICQVSTTVFRGAIYTGMKITQRRNHSYPVHYYTPTGFDATVYIPAPDFRFINNTSGYILLNVEIDGTELIFKYYGTDDGRSVDMQGPFVTDRQPDGAMKTYFTQKVTAKNGDTIIDDIFKSNYKSPDDYPHPGDVAKITSKPDNWSKKEWEEYKKANGL